MGGGGKERKRERWQGKWREGSTWRFAEGPRVSSYATGDESCALDACRCVTRNYGYIGCAVDVLATLDDACSGHRACDLSVSDPALVRTKPCPKDFAAYLDADYRCVPGKNSPPPSLHLCATGLRALRRKYDSIGASAPLSTFLSPFCMFDYT